MLRDIQDIYVSKKPFKSFEIYCEECNKSIFTKDDFIEKSDPMTIALLMRRIEKHAMKTGHDEMGGVVNPKHILKRIDTTITVNG